MEQAINRIVKKLNCLRNEKIPFKINDYAEGVWYLKNEAKIDILEEILTELNVLNDNKDDELKLNTWTAERLKIQQNKELKDKIYDIFTDYLSDKEAAMYNFNEFEVLRKFYNYLDKKL